MPSSSYSRFSDSLYEMLKNVWKPKWEELATKRLISNPLVEPGGPKRLDSIITVKAFVIRLSAQRFTLEMVAFGNDKYGSRGSELAEAYESGSGLQRKQGGRSKYPIVPRRGKYLIFKWDRAIEQIPRTKDGKVLLKKVMHPGVSAANKGRGYIADSAKQLRTGQRMEMIMVGKRSILRELNMAFKSKVRE